MRCIACRRTITPSRAKSFSGFDFCIDCYNDLPLESLHSKELNDYFLSLSSDDTKELFENMVALASQFDSSSSESILKRCISSFDDESADPSKILPFLLPAKALEDSTGSISLSTTGELALVHISQELTSELLGFDYQQVEEIEDDMLKMVCNIIKRHCSICLNILDQLEKSKYTEMIRTELIVCEDIFESLGSLQEVDLTTIQENINIETTEDLCNKLKEKFGVEHVFHGWGELKNELDELNEMFEEDDITLIVPESDSAERELSLLANADIHMITGKNQVFFTSSWEELKESILTNDYDTFIDLISDLGAPIYVLEYAAKDIDHLKTFSKNLLERFPHNIYAVVLYAEILLFQEDMDGAISFLEKKSSEIEDESSLYMELGMLLGATGETEKSIQYLEKAAALEPENANILYLMGKICENSGEFKKAHQFFKKAQKIEPHDVEIFNAKERTRIAAVLSQVEELLSQEEYQKALHIVNTYFDPTEISIFYYYKGIILSRLNRPKEALALITDYLDIYPEDEEGWLEKAGIYLDLGQFAAAARAFRRCSRLNPHDVMPLVWEAICHKQRGRSRDYKRCINKAKRIDREATKELLKQLAF